VPSSGITGVGTSGDAPVQVITPAQLAGGNYNLVTIVNTGSVVGFYCLLGSPALSPIDPTQWNYLTAAVGGVPGGKYVTPIRMGLGGAVWLMRVPSSSDLSGVFISVE